MIPVAEIHALRGEWSLRDDVIEKEPAALVVVFERMREWLDDNAGLEIVVDERSFAGA